MQKFPPHIVQSKAWGEFKTQMGTPAVKVYGIQFTLHKIPMTPYCVGYCPKAIPEDINWAKLYEAGKDHHCTHIKIDVLNTAKGYVPEVSGFKLKKTNPTFAENTFLIDLTKSEKELLEAMHPKTRYNIRLAQKKGVRIKEGGGEEALETFMRLQKITAKAQKFFIHPDNYYRTLWKIFRPQKLAYILLAKHNEELLVAYVLLRYNETLYYTYGGSSTKYKNVMASNFAMWEAIRLGKRLGCKVFDMWGALSENPKPQDPWYGFHRFKSGYGGKLISFPGAWDLVIKPLPYRLFKILDKIRWRVLKLKRL